MLVAFWRVHDYDPFDYRGGLVLFAVAAAVLIGVAAHPSARLGRALGVAPLIWLGARSYGIYLWHWPVLELTRPHRDVPFGGPLLIAGQAALTIAIAALSYRFVEQPIRSGRAQEQLQAWRARSQRGVLAASAGTLAAIAVALGAVFVVPAGGRAAVREVASPAALRPVPHAPKPIRLVHATPPAPSTPHHTPKPRARVVPHVHTRARAGAAPLPPGRILAMGDSVMLGCTKALRQRLGPRLTVDAAVSRQVEDLVERLRTYRTNGVLPQTVIVQLGDNGPVWFRDLASLRSVLSKVPRVVLINARVDRSWQGEVLSAVGTFQRGWRQSRLANWYAHSSDSLLSDGVHPAASGCRIYAGVVVTTLRSFG